MDKNNSVLMLKKIIKNKFTQFEADIKRLQNEKCDQNSMVKRNMTFMSFVLKGFNFKKQKNNCDVLFNIETFTHLREAMPLINALEEKGNKVLIQSTNLSLNDVIEVGSKNILDKDIKLGPLTFINYIIYYLFDIRYFIFSRTIKNLYNNRAINNLISLNKAKYYYFIFIYNMLLKRCNPKFVFIGNDLTFNGRLFTTIAKKYNISNGSLQHGNIYNDFLQKMHVVDTFYCFSSQSAKILAQDFKGRIVVSGSLFINSNLKSFITKSDQIGEYILIAFSGHGHSTSKKNYKQQLKLILNVIQKNKNSKFIIKLHPKEKMEDYSDFSGLKNVTFLNHNKEFQQHSIFPLLMNAKRVVTGISTVALEALILKIPVITLDPLNEYMESDLILNDVTNHAKCFDTLDYLINNSDCSNYSTKYAKKFFGMDSHPIQTIIKEMSL